ncbi:endonuclease/exonuclease/phosphatase family protein [Celeribacter arenosi]|uniref:Endonuclease/exonuclease/phosphatase family protein n=1 Tax=Celeribacter arenosi TaxID=792649 RepID=A0ABP7JYX4_9RHOB
MLLRDIRKGDVPDVVAALEMIEAAAPDILLLTGFDTDYDGLTAAAFAQAAGFDHVYSRIANSGAATGRDLDKDGRLGEPEDAQAYGDFTGQRGMVLLSNLPVDVDASRHFDDLLWKDFAQATIPEGFFDAGDLDILRLSTAGHWDVAVTWQGAPLHVLAFAASAPVFDGDEDRNGRRNADEIALWRAYMSGDLGPAPAGEVVVVGNANLDPLDGDGQHDAIRELLADPRLQDPMPAAVRDMPEPNPEHRGDPTLDTADWSDPMPGNLRVSYVLPAASLSVLDAGLMWSPSGEGEVRFRHAIVWTDLAR